MTYRKKKRTQKRPHGQIRQSQVVTTFGPGALLDLPDYSVLVGGLEGWRGGGDEVLEPRLVEKLQQWLHKPDLKLRLPPPDEDDPTRPKTGIEVWRFPQWFISQDVDQDGPPATAGMKKSVRSRRLVHIKALQKGKLEDDDRKKHRVVPVRFVRACRRGHIDDIDWYAYVHRGDTACRRKLWIDEHSTTGDLSDIVVRCACGAERPMNDAATTDLHALGKCDGARPWLGPHAREYCKEWNRLLVRTASNAYFPQPLRVIALPDRNEDLVKSVDQVWERLLEFVETMDDLEQDRRRKPPVAKALEGFSNEEVMEEIQSRRSGGAPQTAKPVKEAECEILNTSEDEIGSDKPEGDFYARALPRSVWHGDPVMEPIERVVLVHRLREVIALVGFTRFESAAPDLQGELEIGVSRADLALNTSWLPAVENRGEGFYVGFKKEAIETWLAKEAVQQRGRQLMEGFDRWKEAHPNSRRQFFGLPYVMLHSLSHLLITAVALECGYPPSSIRERVYACDAGYGILLYTGSSDAEGTLGGLVEAGRGIVRHLESALELGRLCSNDPVCAQHEPANTYESRYLAGAACHGCLLIAETSCEQHNDFLDRALVVPTIENQGAEFFTV